jgi:hypothetical protein
MLEVHPPHRSAHTPQTALPGDLKWEQSAFRWDHAVWDTAESKGIVRLMSLREANRNQAFYRLMTLMSAQSLNDWDAINVAHHFDLSDSAPSGLAAAHQRTEVRINAAMSENTGAAHE